RHEDEDRLFLIDASEVQQVAVLPVLVVDVRRIDAGRRAPRDKDRLGAERFHRTRSPCGKIGDEFRRAPGRGNPTGKGQPPGDDEGGDEGRNLEPTLHNRILPAACARAAPRRHANEPYLIRSRMSAVDGNRPSVFFEKISRPPARTSKMPRSPWMSS